MQEKLCTELKEPDQGEEAKDSQIAIARSSESIGEERNRLCSGKDQTHGMLQMREIKLYGDFHMATNHRCKYCKITGQLEKCCNRKSPQRQKKMMQSIKSRKTAQGFRRNYYIEESDEEEKEDFQEDEEQLVLRVDGEGSKSFGMEGLMYGNCFKAIIDTGSPVSVFTKHRLQKIVEVTLRYKIMQPIERGECKVNKKHNL